MPPYSDNLYSADEPSQTEDDAQSFSEELSPTDGYFTRREDMPANVYVPDPTVDRKHTEDKVLIPGQTPGARRTSSGAPSRSGEISTSTAATSSNTSTTSAVPSQIYPSIGPYASPPSSVANTPFSPTSTARTVTSNTRATPSSPRQSRQSNSIHSGRTPLMGVPPPAYSPSPISPTSSPQVQQARSYSTFPQTEQGLPPNHDPESMGLPTEERYYDERDPLNEDGYLLPNPIKKIISPGRERARKLLLTVLLLVVFISLMSSLFNISSSGGAQHRDGESGEPHSPYCSSAKINKPLDQISYDFGSSNDLNVIQTTFDSPDSAKSYVSTSGEIILRRLPKDSQYGTHFTIDTIVSHQGLDIQKSWDQNSRTLKISTPQFANLGTSALANQCISLEITVWLPEDAPIANLHVEAVTLTLRVLEDVKLIASGQSKLKTISGRIIFPDFDAKKATFKNVPPIIDQYSSELPSAFIKPNYLFASRRIDIETVSGTIAGLFPLYDHLGLYSKSGSVNAGVIPNNVDPKAPNAAELEIITASSTISVQLPIVDNKNVRLLPPPRDYITRVQSSSGSISGKFYQGSRSVFKSSSGSVKTTLLPILEEKKYARGQSSLETSSTSGSSDIELLEPVYLSLTLYDYHQAPGDMPQPPNIPGQPGHRNEMPPPPKTPEKYQPIGDGDPYLLFPPKVDGKLLGSLAVTRSNETLRSLRAIHSSISGSVTLTYPTAWEGTILAKAISGSIKMSGEGLKIIRTNPGFGRKEILAKKGVDNVGEGSSVEVKTVSGSTKFTIA